MKEEGIFSSTIEADDVFDEPEIHIDLNSKIKIALKCYVGFIRMYVRTLCKTPSNVEIYF